MEIKEKNFFKKVWTSIKDFEGYEEFAAEKVYKAIKYILLFTLIFTLIISFAYTYKFYLAVSDVKDYINNNVDDIKIKNGQLDVISNNKIIIENENNIIPIIIVDTEKNANTDEYMDKMRAYNTGVLLLSDKAILYSNLLNNNEEIYYSNIIGLDIEGKTEFLNLIGGQRLLYYNLVFFLSSFIYLFIVYFASNIVDAIVLGALGYIFARIVRLRLKYKATFNIGVYALTLPLILNLVYIIVNVFSGFEIRNFQWMYQAISYIYVAVAILMIKTEIINQRIQLIRLKEIQEQVSKEAEEKEDAKDKKEDKKNNDKEEKKEDEKTSGEQPEGSNA